MQYKMKEHIFIIYIIIFSHILLCSVECINQKCDNTLKQQQQFSLIKLLSDTQQCPTNSHCTQKNYCACDNGYFGNCQTQGIYLTGESKQYTITQSMSYFIIQPTIDQFVSFQFILCNEKNDQSMSELLNLWVDDGSLITPNNRNALGNDKQLKITQSCIALVTSFFTFSQQSNGQKEILILGIRLKQQGSVKIQLLVQQVQLFGIDIIFRIILVLVCAIALVSLGAVVYCIYKCRRRGTSGGFNQQQNDISFFDQYMPPIKANLHQVKQEICSVCLGQYKQGQQIRHTICAHYFHKTCLDEWCVTNLSCPICRTSFEKANLIHQQYLFSSRNSTQQTSQYQRNQRQLLQNGCINGETNLRQPIV